MSALDAVMSYAARGWQVFPLKPQSKEPCTHRGFYDATSNPATLRRWFAQGFPYNVGIRTGTPSGVFIVDIDGKLGAVNLRELMTKFGALPATLISTTGKGWHLWFRADGEIPCSTGKISPGIDVRADGGYVVAPPSIHPNGKAYRWLNDLPPAPAPAWLIHLAQRKPSLPVTAAPPLPSPSWSPIGIISASSAAYGLAALDREIERLTLASSGNRNAELNRVSFRLHQLVAGQELHSEEVARQLIRATQANGLLAEDGLRQVQATIQSGANAGMRSPRDRHGRR
jgi:putative DNA primase/helicase